MTPFFYSSGCIPPTKTTTTGNARVVEEEIGRSPTVINTSEMLQKNFRMKINIDIQKQSFFRLPTDFQDLDFNFLKLS